MLRSPVMLEGEAFSLGRHGPDAALL